MRRAFRISLLGLGLASWLGAGAAAAGSLVEFPNVSEREPKLLAYLARPTGESAVPVRFDGSHLALPSSGRRPGEQRRPAGALPHCLHRLCLTNDPARSTIACLLPVFGTQ
jgi:hypothetical protein